MVAAMHQPAPLSGLLMIKDLTIINYQSHLNSRFSFYPGVNAIVGVSDSGKSSVFRSLKLVLQNRPLGLSYHSNFAKKEDPTEVYITVQNDKTTKQVGRIRSEDRNEYVVEGFAEPFVAFGTEVPEEVFKILNISDINCQFQMDSPFLFSETPGAAARYLNKIVNLDKIDITLQNIASKKRQNESEIKFNQGRLVELDLGIKAFPDLESIGDKLSKLETLQEELEGYIYTKELLSGLVFSIEDTKSKLDKVYKISKLYPEVKRLEQVVIEKQKLEHLYDVIYIHIQDIENVESKITETQTLVEKYPEVLKLESISEDLDQLQWTRDQLHKDVLDMEKCETKMISINEFIKRESVRLKTLIGTICPLCGSAIGG
jgi:DNA repair protein SbcC/Rad50